MLDFKRIEEDFPELYINKTYRTITLECGNVDLLRIFCIRSSSPFNAQEVYRVLSMTHPLSDFGTNMSSQTMEDDDIYMSLSKNTMRT